MAEYMIKLLAYYILLPIYEKIELNIVEVTVLRYLRCGRTKEYIEKKLELPIAFIIAELQEKGILNEDLSFRYKNIDDWYFEAEKSYRDGYIFYDLEGKMFFNALVFPGEIKLDEEKKLVNYLGHEYVAQDALEDMQVIKTFEVLYDDSNAEQNCPVRKITTSEYEYLDYIYEG